MVRMEVTKMMVEKRVADKCFQSRSTIELCDVLLRTCPWVTAGARGAPHD